MFRFGKDPLRAILISSLMLGLLLSVGIYSSFALFSARTSRPGGAFSVGTLDLSVTDAAGGASESFVIDNLGSDPNPKGSKSWLVKNTGTLSGRLTLATVGLLNTENGCNGQEAPVDNTCGNPGEGAGELGGVIRARVSVNDQEVVPWTKAFADKETLGAVWKAVPSVVLSGGESVKLTLDWEIRPEDYGNEIQSDSLEFNVTVNLEQTSK